MKPKCFSLIATVFAMLAVMMALWFGFRQNEYLLRSSGLEPMTPLADISAPDKAVLSQMDRLERSLPMLASPPVQIRDRANLSAFGYKEVVPSTAMYALDADTSILSSKHRLTLAFKGPSNKFCVIDDQLYAEGAELPDGVTIVKIESQKVLIANRSLQQWLTIDPLQMQGVPKERRRPS